MSTSSEYQQRESVAPPAGPLRLSLVRSVDAPATARAAIAELCEQLDLARPLRSTLVLLVSEVVTNAVLHSDGPSEEPIGLTATVSTATLRVEVTDAGNGFEPVERDASRLHGGYGLHLLDRAARSWGVDGEGRTSVWFELALDA